MKPETLGPIIEALNDILRRWMDTITHEQIEIDAVLAEEIIAHFVALVQLRDKLVDAATSPD